jgi:hypothetical protein
VEQVADSKDANQRKRVSKSCLRVNPTQTSKAVIRLDEESHFTTQGILHAASIPGGCAT